MTTVKDLVTINDGVKADRTLDQFDQWIRIDLVRTIPPKCQILFDRRVIHRMSMSKPLGYVSYSSSMDIFKLASNLMAAGVAMHLDAKRREGEDPQRFVSDAVKSIILLETEDMIMMAKAYLRVLEEEEATI